MVELGRHIKGSNLSPKTWRRLQHTQGGRWGRLVINKYFSYTRWSRKIKHRPTSLLAYQSLQDGWTYQNIAYGRSPRAMCLPLAWIYRFQSVHVRCKRWASISAPCLLSCQWRVGATQGLYHCTIASPISDGRINNRKSGLGFHRLAGSWSWSEIEITRFLVIRILNRNRKWANFRSLVRQTR